MARRIFKAKRWQRQILLGAAAAVCVLVVFIIVGTSRERWLEVDDLKANMFEWRMSMSLAYSALIFLASTLAIGPINVLRRKSLSINNYWRRDVAFWAGVLALSHMVFGLTIHTDGLKLWTLWIMDMEMPGQLPFQQGWFGLANFTGLLQAVIIAMLLLISNDYMMKRLGIRRWKSLQRLAYIAFISIIVHGFSYQRVEFRGRIVQGIFLTFVIITVALQLIGFIATLQKQRQRELTAKTTTT